MLCPVYFPFYVDVYVLLWFMIVADIKLMQIYVLIVLGLAFAYLFNLNFMTRIVSDRPVQ